MELIVPFRKTDFSPDGIHKHSGKFFTELQQEWEEKYHLKFAPWYANVIEGHPLAMQRLTGFFETGNPSVYDFGMELMNGKIDIDTNLEIEKHMDTTTVYAIGSQIVFDEEGDGLPVFLIKNDNLKDDILVLRYEPDDDETRDKITDPVKSAKSK